MKKKVEIDLKESPVFKFRMEQFKELLKIQGKRCFLTGRALTPGNVSGAHIRPLIKGGEHEFKNLSLVIDELKQLKRYNTTDEIVDFAVDIIKTWGKKYGYSIKTNKQRIS